VTLWAWRDAPVVGSTITVTYNAAHDWAKQDGAFAPMWRLLFGFAGGLLFVCAPLAVRWWRGRRAR